MKKMIVIRDVRYLIFANVRYADIFQLILADSRCQYFLLFGNHTKSLLCRNYKLIIFNSINFG